MNNYLKNYTNRVLANLKKEQFIQDLKIIFWEEGGGGGGGGGGADLVDITNKQV